MKKNVASQLVSAQMISTTDGSDVTTGTCNVAVEIDGAAGTGGTATHIANGKWEYAPIQSDTNGDYLTFQFVLSGAVTQTVQIYTTFPQTGDSFARLGAPAGASVSADLATIDSNVDSILADTAEIGAAGAGLTNINLPDQTMNITGNITGNLSGSVGSVTGAVGSVTGAVGSVTGNVGGNVVGSVASVIGAVGSVTGNVGGNVTGSIGSLATQAKADVNAEVDSALDTAIPATPTAGSINDVLKDLDAVLPGSGTLSTLDASAVNDQVVDALATDTYGESGSVPAASASLAAKIQWLATLARNKVTQTATTTTLRNDADSGNVATSTVSDDGTTFTRGEWS